MDFTLKQSKSVIQGYKLADKVGIWSMLCTYSMAQQVIDGSLLELTDLSQTYMNDGIIQFRVALHTVFYFVAEDWQQQSSEVRGSPLRVCAQRLWVLWGCKERTGGLHQGSGGMTTASTYFLVV